MDISQLRYFLEICRCGSISQAANHLYMSQQGVSRSLIRLEAELNTSLFIRQKGGILLTETGEMLRKEAGEIVKRADYIQEYCANHSKGEVLTVVCSSSIITDLPPKAQRLLFQQSDETVPIKLLETNTSDCEERLSNGTADVGILWGECDSERFDSLELIERFQMVVVNSASSLATLSHVSPKELHGWPSIVPHPETRHGRVIRQAFLQEGAELNVVFNCGRVRDVIELVEKNPDLAGYIMDDDTKYVDGKTCKVIPFHVTGAPLPIPVCFVTPKGHQLTMGERYFRRLLADYCGKY